jgi:folate-binding protein YgfZ
MTEHPLFAILHSRALVRVSGPDWRSFLQGLLTQDVETLAPGELRFAGLLTPQGKLLFDLFLFGQDDGCLIDVAADRREALIQRLTLYRLRAKVEIQADPRLVSALWPATTPLASGWAIDPRLSSLGARGYGADAPAGALARDEAVYEHHRLAQGAPDPARDCPPETTYPIEANFDLLGGIDFKKGCFVGQETTSRMKRRGTIKTRMMPIRVVGPTPAFGAEVLAGTLRAGEVLTGAEGTAMALLRLDRIDGADLTVEGRPVIVERPAYLDDAEPTPGLTKPA